MEFDVAGRMQNLALLMPVLLLSLTIHEVAHAVTADRLGDPTAKRLGRITLNPLAHIDWIGTVIIPCVMILSSGFTFIGWAKPVPVNLMNLKDWRRDDSIIAVAGPLSNVAIALSLGILYLLFNLLGQFGLAGTEAAKFIFEITYLGILLNVGLAVFNMLPVPPLDGSHLLANYLPHPHGDTIRQIGFYGIFILILLLNFTPLGRLVGWLCTTLATPILALMSVSA